VSSPADPPVVVITGAAGPLGRAAAGRFARDGASLVLVGRDPGRLADVAREADLEPERRLLLSADLRDRAAARSMAEQATARFGRIDVLLHAVGGWVGGTAVVDLDPDEVRTMLDSHVWTTLHTFAAVVPGMVERGFGRVMAVSSPMAATPGAKGASYALAKAAEEVVLRSLAKEAAGTGVTANLLVVRSIAVAGQAGGTPAGQLAEVIAYLASPGGGAVNGQRIAVGA
jgi:NADP-dependent 3-hydroxy acid dehydrogenase YdfG